MYLNGTLVSTVFSVIVSFLNGNRCLMSILCSFDPCLINTNFNMLKEADYFFHTLWPPEAELKCAQITEHYVAPRRALEQKQPVSGPEKRGKGWAYWLANHNFGCACIRNQFRKIPVEERRRSGACRPLSCKIKISLCAVRETAFSSRCILRFCSTSFRGSRLQAPLKVLLVGTWTGLVLFWCEQWWPLTKTQRMTQWP